ncbi:MAG TPA: HIT family protein [Hyphomonadaceae bacterium]|jgi:histidine triad (HIT) family protein|nr:HIT family protein [Hyphomonadaceae bacterium]
MSLKGEYDGGNIFAKILRGEAPCVKIFEDADVLAFMDIFPQSQGHCLVIPKNTTARMITDFPPERIGTLFIAAQKLTKAVIKALNPDGVIVQQFNGAPSGQTIFHLHVHVVPTYINLPLQRHHAGKPADLDVLREQAAKIAAAL